MTATTQAIAPAISHAAGPGTASATSGKSRPAAATDFSALLAGADDQPATDLPAVTITGAMEDSLGKSPGNSSHDPDGEAEQDEHALIAAAIQLPAGDLTDTLADSSTVPADNPVEEVNLPVAATAAGNTTLPPLSGEESEIAHVAGSAADSESTVRPAVARPATIIPAAAAAADTTDAQSEAEISITGTAHAAPRSSADSGPSGTRPSGEAQGISVRTLTDAEAGNPSSGNGRQDHPESGAGRTAAMPSSVAVAETADATLRFDLPLTAGRPLAAANPVTTTATLSPTLAATAESLAASGPDDGLLTVAVGGDDRLDIRIGAPSSELAERVSAGLDHLRHDLRTIGAEVEAIRVEVRNERGSNASDAVADSRQSAADEDASDPSSRNNPHDNGSQSGTTRNGSSRSDQAQNRQGQNGNDASTSPLSAIALRLDARATAADIRVDRYA